MAGMVAKLPELHQQRVDQANGKEIKPEVGRHGWNPIGMADHKAAPRAVDCPQLPGRGHRLGVLIPIKNLGQRRLPVRTRRKVWRKPHHRPALERQRPGRGRATQWPSRHGGLQCGLTGGMAHGQGHCGPVGPGARLAAQPLLVTGCGSCPRAPAASPG